MEVLRRLAGPLVLGALLVAPAAPAFALGISLPGTATITNLKPGATSTATGISLTITGVVTPWSLTVTPAATATTGRMRATSGTCTGSTAALNNPLTLTTSSTLGTTTVDRPTLALSSATTQIAHGTLADVLTIGYSQTVDATELLAQGCLYAINLTFTVS